jgi:hypothetical protein
MDDPRHPIVDLAAGPADRFPDAGELAEGNLRRSGYLALWQLSCEFHTGVLTLRGRLPSYHLKQVALAAVATVEGVRRIDDQVLVAARSASDGSGR